MSLWRYTVFFCLAGLAFAGASFGWGAGHEEVAREVFARLPQSITGQISPAMVDKATLTYSHYPDSFALFLPEEVGAPAVKYLNDNGIKNRYGIHSDKGRALAFCLLVTAFREKQYDHAAVWIAALSHSTSDMAAINHDPLVHGVIYSSGYKLKLKDGKSISGLHCFDLSDLARNNPAGLAAWQKSIDPMLIPDDGRGAETALIDIMGYGQQGAFFCSPRGIPILTNAVAAVENQDGAARDRANAQLADLGAWAVARTVRDTEVAARLAAGNDTVELTPQIEAKFNDLNAQALQSSKLDDDALFTPILRPLPKDGGPVIGVLLEPTWRMNDALLGYGDRVWSAAICRSLAAAKRDYATLDVRSVLSDGFPSPSRVPVMVVSATGLRNYSYMHVADLDDKLQKYLDAGGHVLWIGGDAKPSNALGPMVTAMSRIDKQLLPVPEDQIVGTKFELMGDPTGQSQWSFVRSPSLKVGWSQPLCPWKFAESTDLEPLVELVKDDQKTVVGVMWKGSDGKGEKAAYLPVYAVAPHLFTESQLLETPGEPALDPPCETIVFDVLDRLAK
jgi:hypothetical protein